MRQFSDMSIQANSILSDINNRYRSNDVNIASLLYFSQVTNTVKYRVGLFPDIYEARLWLRTISAQYENLDMEYSCYINGICEGDLS